MREGSWWVETPPSCILGKGGFVVGMISLHLLETHEGGLLWVGKPSALHFQAKEGSEEREVVLN